MSLQNEPTNTPGEGVKGSRESSGPSSTEWTTWVLRPIVLFAAAYTIVGILHEWTHALTAYAFKVPSTLFHLYVQLDRTAGTLNDRAIIRVASPLFCLVVGLACWLAYRMAKSPRGKLLLLYFAWFGVTTFFGNLMSTPFVGDFSGLALVFQLSMPVRYTLGLLGVLSLCGLSFLVGTELRKWAPAEVGGAKAMLGMVAIPVILGTAAVLLIHLPMPSAFAAARVTEPVFWVFGAVGTWISRKKPANHSQNLGVAGRTSQFLSWRFWP